MKHSALLIGALALALTTVTPQMSFARSGPDVWKSSDRVALVNERVAERRAEIEERRASIYDRVCERLIAIQERIGISFPLPPFCEDVEPEPEPEPVDPPTVDLEAGPLTIEEGATSTLSWTSTDADECVASGSLEFNGDVATSGLEIVSPATTTVYSIECENDSGTSSDSVTVTVEEAEQEPKPLPTTSLSAAPDEIDEGATSTLSWTSTNADTCTASGSDEFDGDVATSGTLEVSPDVDTTYELECENETGTSSDSVTVTVEELAPEPSPTVNLSAASTSIELGTSTSLVWTTEHANACEASGSDEFTGPVATSGTLVVEPTADTHYLLECTGPGGSGSDSVTVLVNDPEAPAVDHLLLSEVVYDPEDSETENEWIEIFNGTGVDVDLTGWQLEDAAGNIHTFESVTLPDGEFLLVTSSSTTDDLADFPEDTLVVYTGSTLGLNNNGDALFLRDDEDAEVDALSWGDVTEVLDPSAPNVGEGHSLSRVDLEIDSDTAGDWEDLEVPTPGA
jgi:hypothetical protein